HAGLVAEPGNRDAEPIGGLDDRLACERVHLSTVELEDDALLLERVHQGCVHAEPLESRSSCGKYLSTQAIGFGAAWPRPQIDASAIACDRDRKSTRLNSSHRLLSRMP